MCRCISATLVLTVVVAGAYARPATEFVKTTDANIEGTVYKVWDMMVTVEDDWSTSWLDLTLNSGHMYQGGLVGADTEPNPAFVGIFPDLEWDTYAAVPGGYPDLASFAGSPTIDATDFDATWFDDPNFPDGPGTWKVARITLSPDSYGTLEGQSWGGPEPAVCCVFPFEYYIVAGQIVPEPATLAMLAVGALVLLRQRGRRLEGCKYTWHHKASSRFHT